MSTNSSPIAANTADEYYIKCFDALDHLNPLEAFQLFNSSDFKIDGKMCDLATARGYCEFISNGIKRKRMICLCHMNSGSTVELKDIKNLSPMDLLGDIVKHTKQCTVSPERTEAWRQTIESNSEVEAGVMLMISLLREKVNSSMVEKSVATKLTAKELRALESSPVIDRTLRLKLRKMYDEIVLDDPKIKQAIEFAIAHNTIQFICELDMLHPEHLNKLFTMNQSLAVDYVIQLDLEEMTPYEVKAYLATIPIYDETMFKVFATRVMEKQKIKVCKIAKLLMCTNNLPLLRWFVSVTDPADFDDEFELLHNDCGRYLNKLSTRSLSYAIDHDFAEMMKAMRNIKRASFSGHLHQLGPKMKAFYDTLKK